MSTTRGRDLHARIRGTAAEFIEPIRIRPKDGGIAIHPDLDPALKGMRMMDPGDVLFELIEIAIRTEDGAGGLIVWLV